MYTCIVRILGTPVEVDTSVQQFFLILIPYPPPPSHSIVNEILWGCQTYF
jgi:hypothetical protein